VVGRSCPASSFVLRMRGSSCSASSGMRGRSRSTRLRTGTSGRGSMIITRQSGASGGNIGVVLQPGPRVTVRDQAGVVVVVVPSPSSRTRTISSSIAAQQVAPLLYQALGPAREVLVRSVLTSQLIYMLSQSCSLQLFPRHVKIFKFTQNFHHNTHVGDIIVSIYSLKQFFPDI